MLNHLNEIKPRLRPSERKLALYVEAAPREIVDLSMTELAERAGVSQPTIARFCQAMGCSGFREFKIRLAQSFAPGLPVVYRDVLPDEGAAGIVAKVFERTVMTLMEVRNSLSTDNVQRAISLLAGARRIEFYGAGGSGMVASDMQHKFFRLGIPSVAYSDPHTFSMSAALLAAGDVLVAVSNTGRTRDIIDAARSAQGCGACVIAITHGHSPLARLADVALVANLDEDTDIYAPMTSRISHLAIGDALAVGVALQHGPKLTEKLAHAKEILKRRRLA